MLLLDPDLVVFNKDLLVEWAPKPLKPLVNKFSMDSMSRVNKAIVHGGLYLAGDDFKNQTSVEMAEEVSKQVFGAREGKRKQTEKQNIFTNKHVSPVPPTPPHTQNKCKM